MARQCTHCEGQLQIEDRICRRCGTVVPDVANEGTRRQRLPTAFAGAPVLHDEPAETDYLNFAEYSTALRAIVVDPRTDTPLVIGIFGRWGSGKTTLMRMLERELRAKSVITIWFNAWRYSQEEHMWAAFLQSLTRRVSSHLTLRGRTAFAGRIFWRRIDWSTLIDHGPALAARAFLVAIPALLGSALVAAAKTEAVQDALRTSTWLSSGALAIWLFVRPAARAVSERVTPDLTLYRALDYRKHIAFLDEFREHFQTIINALPRSASTKVVVFIDDLDRCGASKTLELLDALKVFLDVTRCIFVIGVDPRIVQAAVAIKYPSDVDAQREYIGKIVQLPFHLPTLTPEDMRDYVARLVEAFPDDRCRDVFVEALSMNPREVKRVINMYSLLWQLALARESQLGQSITPVRLAKLVVIQHTNPGLYDVLREEPRLLAELESFFRTRAGGANIVNLAGTASAAGANTRVVGTADLAVPAALSSFTENSALSRLLLLHPLAANNDDASFANLGGVEIAVYFTLTRRARVTTLADVLEPTRAAEPRFGERYELIRKLGAGGSSTVYLVQDTKLNRQVALKHLTDALSRTVSWQQRFRREIDILSRTAPHPNVIQLFDVGALHGDEGPITYYTMEYLEGGSIADLVNARVAFDLAQVYHLLVPIFDALTHIHAAGVVHRDVKPESILLDRRGNPKLSDFGIGIIGDDQNVTATGETIGTPAYMSPEQIQADPIDHRSDLFSFGVVLYTALTGKHPFLGEEDSAMQVMFKIVEGAFVAPTSLAPTLPSALDGVFTRLMAPMPDDRYESADEAKAAFTDALGPAAPSGARVPPSDASRSAGLRTSVS